jgi:hypothetical protein
MQQQELEEDQIVISKYKFKIKTKSQPVESRENILNQIESNKYTHLYLEGRFNDKVFIDNISSRIIYLWIGHYYQKNKLDDLPNSIKTLIIGCRFNEEINNLPCKLNKLHLGHSFNKQVDNLPNTLETLIFNFAFNKPVDKLPTGLKKITFGHSFNQPVNKLPPNLEIIYFDWRFNQNISNLPENIYSLKLKNDFNKELICLPKKLKKLKLNCSYYNKPLNNLPESIEELDISLPKMFGFGLYHYVRHFNECELPESLKKTYFKCLKKKFGYTKEFKELLENNDCSKYF